MELNTKFSHYFSLDKNIKIFLAKMVIPDVIYFIYMMIITRVLRRGNNAAPTDVINTKESTEFFYLL